jgi:hypothetical protein
MEEERKRPRVLPDKPKIAPVDPVIAGEKLAQKGDTIMSDVLGSYTGIAADGTKPQQDADDL